MPDERHPPTDAASSPESTEPAGDALVKKSVAPAGDGPASESVDSASDAPATRAAESAGATPNDGYEPISASAPRPAQATSPLITAIEIENFKGIGRPVRIDLRPITLLFGNNSTGKSTVLHALCYAHEILSHHNVDAHKTEIGGDRIDLGGFRNFVHAHDPTHTVRLRFELNLEDWRVPQSLDEKLVSPFDEGGGDADSSLFRNPSERPRSGWLELQADLRGHQPVLASYELGINNALVGRLHARHPAAVALEFSPVHPLLEWARHSRPVGPIGDQEREAQSAQTDTQTDRVRDVAGSETDGWQQSHVAVLGLASPLPHWNELLFLDGRELARSVVDDQNSLWFEALVSALFVGIGQTLRDELASIRYIGPTRDLHPRTTIESGKPASACWADGSAAWTHLHNSPRRDLIDEVGNWLAQKDRLDTGYALQARSILEIREDTPLVSLIREYQTLREEFGNTEGRVDLDRWVHKKTEKSIEDIRERLNAHLHDVYGRVAQVDQAVHELTREFSIEGLVARIKASENEDILTSVKPESQNYRLVPERVARALREEYHRLTELVAKMEKRDFTATEIDELAAAMATRPPQRELQLVTTKTGLPVRPSDVGVGISQILPVVVAALDSDRPGITAIEQPELHLHPRIQVELGDLFAQQTENGGIFLIETHSEHLLLRFMRRMRQTSDGTLDDGAPEVRPEDIAVLFVEIDPDGEQTLVREMPLNERGELVEAWPGGFFEEDLREIF